ncbi:phosphate ABC transporter permease subunit PstC [Cohnella sp. CIP 111063]|uniref:phosphate ABC transporter permease subunit PstC n=1 Tax=unclassified Cohnella TaxID=2636738 RepID=UPI000B8C665A|nr:MULTISPECIES: phosphate ABC transporter permease subunit PstC [unclassified Cohnella]OXS62766.1 phosphate ABC transporter permease subunit PstC [Cohnella sp. CIP 111063]PRX75044.1 phosphate ABC transporter membrane protein 1 (PhoT family) [Cohnella sp. SGD-V74]
MQLDTSARPSIAGPNASELGGSIKAGSGKSFDRKNRLLFYNRFFKLACIASAVFVCLILFGILFLMFRTGVLTFRDVSPMTFFFSTDWTPEDDRYGAFVFIFGTFALTLLTLLISVPLSVVIAVFLAEVAPTWLRNLLRPVLDLLVGIPSVVYGFLGLTILIPLLRDITGTNMGDGILAAAIVLTIMVLPTISRVSDDAISAVPRKYRDASYALGATRFQTIFKVTIPAARSGILYGVILGMARAIGETMAVVMVIGNTPQLADALFKPTSVLTSNIVMQIANVPFDSTWNNALYMMGFLLLVISLLMIVLVRLLQRKGAHS